MKSKIYLPLCLLPFILILMLSSCTSSVSDSVLEATETIDDSINSLEDIYKLNEIISISAADITEQDRMVYTEIVNAYELTENTDERASFKIMYKSDNFEVAGLIIAPADYLERDYPVLIYNRSGYNQIKNIPGSLWPMSDFGFIVMASEYRGNEGGTGKDEFGGGDVQDVISLIDIAEQLPFSNGKIFMLGDSRGGLQVYVTLKEENLAGRDRITAAVVSSGVSDLVEIYELRSGLIRTYLLNAIGDNPQNAPEEYEKRSAINWPELLNCPILITHGADDKNSPVSQANLMYNKLLEFGKDVDLFIYDSGHDDTPESYKIRYLWLLQHNM